MKTCAFFRPTILREKIRDLDREMADMRPEEIVEILGTDLFDRLLKQYVYDENVVLKSLKRVNNKNIIEAKQEQSTSQFSMHDKFEDVGEVGEERKSATTRSKGDKADNALENKDAIKELLEKNRQSPWIARIYIIIIVAFLLGLMTIYISSYLFWYKIFNELKDSYIYAELNGRKTAELNCVKNHIRSLIFRNL